MLSGINAFSKIHKFINIVDFIIGHLEIGELLDITIIETNCCWLGECSIINTGKDKAASRGVLCTSITIARCDIATKTYPHTFMSLDGSALGQRHVCRSTGASADKLAVDIVADGVAEPVHRHHQVVVLADGKAPAAREVLDGALHATLVAVGEGACLGKVVVEAPAAVLLTAHDAGLASIAILVGKGIEAHKHLPCHISVEGTSKRRTFIVSSIKIVRSK